MCSASRSLLSMRPLLFARRSILNKKENEPRDGRRPPAAHDELGCNMQCMDRPNYKETGEFRLAQLSAQPREDLRPNEGNAQAALPHIAAALTLTCRRREAQSSADVVRGEEHPRDVVHQELVRKLEQPRRR